ncbi:MAG: hypothetical protein ACI9XO_001718 [Paraglaciecola sp.]
MWSTEKKHFYDSADLINFFVLDNNELHLEFKDGRKFSYDCKYNESRDLVFLIPSKGVTEEDGFWNTKLYIIIRKVTEFEADIFINAYGFPHDKNIHLDKD